MCISFFLSHSILDEDEFNFRVIGSWFTTMVGYFKGDYPVSKPPVHVISHFQSAKRFCLNSIILSLTVS